MKEDNINDYMKNVLDHKYKTKIANMDLIINDLVNMMKEKKFSNAFINTVVYSIRNQKNAIEIIQMSKE